MERLQKVIAHSGYTSRRNAEKLILEGKVEVNGQVVTELGTKVSSKDTIIVEGREIIKEEKAYYLFYKPAGVVCTMKDEHGRKCVADFFTDVEQRVYPVGRLDYDTTGALIMTNDGEFANMIMHPSTHFEKVYDVSVKGIVSNETVKKMEKGIYLEGVKTLPCAIMVIGKDLDHKTTMLSIVLTEGKNRQVKKMFESQGHPVKRLHRCGIGFLDLKGLKPGEYRRLKKHEIHKLYALANEKKKAR